MSEQAPVLDRKAFAIDLRRAGLAGIDFEDWDGLADVQAVGLVQFMQNVTIDPELVKEYTHEV